MNVQALLAEREGYVRRGLVSRVAAVDHELELLGFAVDNSTGADADADDDAEPFPEDMAERPAKRSRR